MIEENIPRDSGSPLRPFSSRFSAADMDVEAATQYVRTGGSGPAVLLLHGFGDTGDMWQPLAERLVNDHRVIVPDLRGMGLSHLRKNKNAIEELIGKDMTPN